MGHLDRAVVPLLASVVVTAMAACAHIEAPDHRRADPVELTQLLTAKRCQGCNLRGADLRNRSLAGADLRGANLRDANLQSALLVSADLSGANLRNASLDGADLKNAHLIRIDARDASLNGANLSGADLTGSVLTRAQMRGAILDSTDLSEARLFAAALDKAHLIHVNLTNAVLADATLIGARLFEVSLSKTDLNGADLTDADLTGAKLPGANLLGAQLRGTNPGATNRTFLVGLREELKRTGHRDQERQVTATINRQKQADMAWPELWFHRVFFEYTSDYGASPGRPLWILFGFIVVFMFFYVEPIADHSPAKSAGIWRVWDKERVQRDATADTPERLTGWRWSAFGWALYFSLLSAFHIGWRELNVGNWIARIQRREYVLRATGWVRVVSGIQSLISVYLLALWALTYFGRPFD